MNEISLDNDSSNILFKDNFVLIGWNPINRYILFIPFAIIILCLGKTLARYAILMLVSFNYGGVGEDMGGSLGFVIDLLADAVRIVLFAIAIHDVVPKRKKLFAIIGSASIGVVAALIIGYMTLHLAYIPHEEKLTVLIVGSVWILTSFGLILFFHNHYQKLRQRLLEGVV